MPNIFVENKARWLEIANNDFDYSILFIKCFLPFNAWYCNNYPQHNNIDSKIIHALKSEDNIFKTRIISLLEGNDLESKVFRENIINLHIILERIRVPSNTNRISFSDINFRENPIKSKAKTYNRNTYKAEFFSPTTPPHHYKIKLTIVKTVGHASLFSYQHNKYEKENLQANNDFINLSPKMQEIIIDLFDEVNPKKKECLILPTKKNSFSKFETVFFINNSDLIAQAIIETIYRLRCILFHGEITPTKDNLSIYEYAYYILKSTIKTLH